LPPKTKREISVRPSRKILLIRPFLLVKPTSFSVTRGADHCCTIARHIATGTYCQCIAGVKGKVLKTFSDTDWDQGWKNTERTVEYIPSPVVCGVWLWLHM